MSLDLYSLLVEQVFTMVSWLIPVLLLIASFKLLFLSHLKGIEGERQVKNQLKKLGLEAIHDVILPVGNGNLTQIDHIVLLSDEILVIETKNYRGLLFGNASDSVWTHKIGRRTHRLQNPLRQNNLHIKAVQALKPGVPVSGLVIFTNYSKFPKGIPHGVIQLKDLKKYLGHHTFTETRETIKDAWEILKFNARTDKASKKEHMAQIEKKYGKDKKRFAAYIFLPISIMWLLTNLVSSNTSPTQSSYVEHHGNSIKGSHKSANKNQQQLIKNYMTSQRDRYIEKMQHNVSDSSRCAIYKTRFKETGQSHQSSATGAFAMDMTNIWGEVKKSGCSKKNKHTSNNQSQAIASINWSKNSTVKSSNLKLETARDKCNSLIFKALISRNEVDVERRDKVCKEYSTLKNN